MRYLSKIRLLITIAVLALLLLITSNTRAEDENANAYNVIMADLDSLYGTCPLPDQDYPICFMEFFEGPELLDGVTYQSLDSLFLEPDLFAKAKAAAVLSKGIIADTVESIERLIFELNKEIDNPFSLEYRHLSTIPESECIKGEYGIALINLVGKANQNLILPYIQSSTGESRDRLIIALGYLGDDDIRNQVREIYLNSTNGYIRLSAMDVIARHPDSLDIPIIATALNDKFVTNEINENPYPIRRKAENAAANLGLAIEMQGDNYIIVKDQ